MPRPSAKPDAPAVAAAAPAAVPVAAPSAPAANWPLPQSGGSYIRQPDGTLTPAPSQE